MTYPVMSTSVPWSLVKSGFKKTPRFNTSTQKTAAGRGRSSISYMPYPGWDFEVDLNSVLGGEAVENSVLQNFLSCYVQCCGGGSPFLFTDPNDNAVTDMNTSLMLNVTPGAAAPMGNAGDGSSTAFQLARRVGQGTDILQNVLNPTIYKYDWQGIKNLLLSSGSVGDANWVVAYSNAGSGIAQQAPLITQNAAFAPDGTYTAAKIVFAQAPLSGDAHEIYQFGNNNFLAPSAKLGGRTFTFSIWLRVDSGANTLQCQISDNITEGSGTQFALTTQWKQFSFTYTFTAGNTNTSCYGLIGSQYPISSAGTLYAWGAQLEEGPAPTTYVPVGGAHQGPIQQFPFARTNKCPWSQAFNGHWSLPVPTGSSLTDNAIAAPDGTTTACAYAYPGNTDSYAILGCGAGATKTIYTASWWGRVASGTKVVGFGITDASGASFANGAVTLTTKWQKFTLTGTSPASNMATMQMFIAGNGSLNGVSAGTFYMWGAQLEVGSSATSYIPTSGAAVTVTDYSSSSTGVVTFAFAPGNGALLQWTGPFQYLCQFTDDTLKDLARVSKNPSGFLWSCSSIAFESVFV